jgi:hypothetical protein
MKKNYLLLTAILLFCNILDAQELQGAHPKEVKPLRSEATSAKTMKAGHDPLEGETIEHLDAVILAIDHKVSFVKNDEEQHKKALETGWYDKMAKSREKLVAKREALLEREQAR